MTFDSVSKMQASGGDGGRSASIEEKLTVLLREVKELRARVANAGGGTNGRGRQRKERPVVTLDKVKVGDKGPTPVLNAAVETLLRHRPMTTRELMEATGARFGRVSGAIVELQKRRLVVNLGQPNRGLWWVPDEAVVDRLRAVREPGASRVSRRAA